MSIPRIIVTGLSGGTGKTTISLGITRAFAQDGLCVHPFKKGPDYIDTAWLELASGGRTGNLDPFFLDGNALRRQFITRSSGADIAVIEGNRGYFDGRDIAGSASTAELARHLDAPVILAVNITKMTRTTAALVAGCKNFPGGERIVGIILNYAGGNRHAAIARQAVEELAGLPVLGVLPRLSEAPIFERRAGLITVDMHENAEDSLEKTAAFVREHVDLKTVLDLAHKAQHLQIAQEPTEKKPARARIGVVRDDALWQYYAENLEALCHAGAELVFLSLFDAAPWPEIDALYLGGGDIAPYASLLAAGVERQKEIKARIESGLPVYAEHAGYFYLCRVLAHAEKAYAMSGVFPVNIATTVKPVRLGYVEAVVNAENPFFTTGISFKGHEYHYANITMDGSVSSTLQKTTGTARHEDTDGLVYKNAFGTAMQLYAPAVPQWAHSFVHAAAKWRAEK